MAREDYLVTGALGMARRELASTLTLGACTRSACRRACFAALASAAYQTRATADAARAAGTGAAGLLRASRAAGAFTTGLA